jgi:hypothetical protein
MTATLGTLATRLAASPKNLPAAGDVLGRLRVIREYIALASQASGDTIQLPDLPVGFKFAFGMVHTDTSLGTATISIGPASSAAKYRAAATLTATDTPTPFGKVSAKTPAADATGGALSAAETNLVTVGTAALPSSGNLVVEFYGTID